MKKLLKRKLRGFLNSLYFKWVSHRIPPEYEWSKEWLKYRDFVNAHSSVVYSVREIVLEIENSKYKWVGAVYDNECVYGIANGNEKCIIFNLKDESINYSGELTDDNFKWSGGCVWKGIVYGFPRSSRELLIIDNIKLHKIYTINLGIDYNTEHHYGGCMTKNGIVYQPPRNTDHILRIDLETYNATKILFPNPRKKHRYCGSILHPNGLIYFFPEYKEKVIVLDPLNDQMYFIGKCINSMVFGAAIGPDGNIYGFSAYGYGIVKIDVLTNQVSTLYPGKKFGCYGTELGINGKIYGIPGNGDIMYQFDVLKGELKELYSIRENISAKCAGGVVARDGRIVCIPAMGNKIYIYTPDTKITVPEHIVNSGWMNNCY